MTTIVHLSQSNQRRHGSALKRGLSRRHVVLAFVLITGAFLFFQLSWLSRLGGDEIVGIAARSPSPGDPTGLPPCPSIDTEPFKSGLICINKCAPSDDNTLQGLGLDPNERVKISMKENLVNVPVIEYGLYRINFPEEGIHLNLTGRLAAEMTHAVEAAQAAHSESIVDNNYLQNRAITERLLRRIVAKLLRAAVLDPSENILNTGSWIGDNALPWALLMQHLRPDNPGKVIAVDPSENFVHDMVDLANANHVGNLCAHVGILSDGSGRVAYIGTSADHIAVQTEEHIMEGSFRKRERYGVRGIFVNSTTVDSFNLQNVSLLHLDVEGHEGEVLVGARETIRQFRPIIITEGFYIWPDPKDKNDQHVLAALTELGYNSATEIPEYCGIKANARNRIWWPDNKTRDSAMAIIGKDLQRERVVSWISPELE